MSDEFEDKVFQHALNVIIKNINNTDLSDEEFLELLETAEEEIWKMKEMQPDE